MPTHRRKTTRRQNQQTQRVTGVMAPTPDDWITRPTTTLCLKCLQMFKKNQKHEKGSRHYQKLKKQRYLIEEELDLHEGHPFGGGDFKTALPKTVTVTIVY